MSKTEKTKSEIGKSSRARGKRAEREAANKITEFFQKFGGELSEVVQPRRSVQYSGRQAEGTAPDIIGTPGVSCEIKHVERINLRNALTQSIESAMPNTIPVVLSKKSRCTPNWIAVMQMDDWLEMYRCYLIVHGTEQDGDK